ncbi:hypothetical protein WCQ02_33380 [Paraburkholderia tropica]|uniref:hypothetical protein n=1 Tax=Paraburkholderia tropica TaxID=92647 RepID=UPI003016AB9F
MFEHATFSGTIGFREELFPISFSVNVDVSCRLNIDCDPLPVEAFRHLRQACGRPGEISQALTLRGRSEDGHWTFSSTDIEVRGYRLAPSGYRIDVFALAAGLTSTISDTEVSLLRFRLRGYKSIPHAPIATALGTLMVRGSGRPADADEVCGVIELKQQHKNDFPDWTCQADAMIGFVHRGICFGRGNRSQVPVTECIHGGALELVFYSGPSSPPGLAVIPPFDQQRFLEALVRRHESSTAFPSALWTVVGWLQSDTGFDEGRFLVAMTALETVLGCVLSVDNYVAPKADFEVLRDQLLTTVKCFSIGEDSRAIFEGKVRGLNQRSFSQKIDSLIRRYALPTDVFSEEAIKSIIKLRNDVVHRGVVASRGPMWESVLLVRDLVSRVILRELDYNGSHESYTHLYAKQHSKA